MTDSFWTKVLWSRFIKHFRKLTDEQIIKDIHESMDALEDNDASGDSFGAKMVSWANERRNEKAAVASRENGNLGGRPRKKSNDQGTTEISTNNAGNPLTEESATSGQKTDNPLDAGDAAQGDRAEATTTVSGKPIAKDADTRKDSENVTDTVNGVTLESGTSFAQFKGADATTRKGVGNTTPVGDYVTPEYATSAPTLFLAPARGSGKPKAAGRVHPSSLPSTAADGPAKHPYGEFQNVMLTTEEFQKFVTSEGAQRANGLIEELSSYLASSGKRYKSHYATLLNWARRKKDEETPKQRYMTADDISRRNAEEGWRQLQLMHNQGNG